MSRTIGKENGFRKIEKTQQGQTYQESYKKDSKLRFALTIFPLPTICHHSQLCLVALVLGRNCLNLINTTNNQITT